MARLFFSRNNNEDGISIFWVVVIVIGISAALVLVSFTIFLNSGAYSTVKQITAAAQTLQKDDLEGYDTTSPIRADTLGSYMRGLEAKVQGLDDSKDFRQDLLDKEDLGY